eukprot:scaffold98_cov172-Amphora_coffeaeformis.AAC.24
MMMEDSMDIDEAHHRNIRRVRKAPSPPGSEIFAVVPDPKRQMVTASPSSTIMEASALQSAPIPSPDDVLVHMIQQSGAKTSAEVISCRRCDRRQRVDQCYVAVDDGCVRAHARTTNE